MQPRKCFTEKKCFLTVREADPYLDSLRAAEHPERAKRLNVYFHAACGYYHIGHNYGRLTERTARRGKHRRVIPPTA